MNLLKTFSKYAVGSLLSLIIGFASTMILTRLFSTEEMGKYSMYAMVGGLIASIVYLGLDQSYVRFYFEEQEEARTSLLVRCLMIPLLLTAVVSAVLLMANGLFSDYIIGEESVVLVLLFAVYIFALTMNRFMLLKIRMAQKAVAYSALGIINKSFYLLLAILLYYMVFTGKSWALIIAATAAELVMLSAAFFTERKTFTGRRREAASSSKQLLKYGIPFLFATTITILFESADKIMLKALTDYDEIGLYTGAQSIVNLVAQVQTVFSTFWLPVAFEHFNKDPEDTEFYVRVNKIVSYVMLVIFVIVLAAKDIIIYFLGPDYRGASFIFPFLAFMPVMYTVSETTVLGINFKKKTGYHVWISLACVAANMIGNFILITHFGATGAAISTGFAYVLFFVLRTILAGRVYPVRFALGRFAVCSALVAVMAGFASFYSVHWWYLILAAGVLSIITFLYRDVVTFGLREIKNALRKKRG